MKKKISIIAIILTALFVGWKLLGTKNNTKPVESAQVILSDLKDTLTMSGKIEADKKAVLRFGTAGKISWINARIGQTVKKWQGVAGLDLGDLQASQTKAWYSYLAADANAKQIEDEVKGHATDESYVQKNKRVTAQTSRDIAYDNWLIAKRNLGMATIFSPIDGVIQSAPDLLAGSYITNPTQAEFEIVDPKSIYFSASADQSEVVLLTTNFPGSLRLDAYGEKQYLGTIDQIAFIPKEGEVSTVYEIKFKINPTDIPSGIRLGMTGDMSVAIAERKSVLTLPAKFIQIEKDKKFVYADNKKKETIPITTGLETNDMVEILSGLSENQIVYD